MLALCFLVVPRFCQEGLQLPVSPSQDSSPTPTSQQFRVLCLTRRTPRFSVDQTHAALPSKEISLFWNQLCVTMAWEHRLQLPQIPCTIKSHKSRHLGIWLSGLESMQLNREDLSSDPSIYMGQTTTPVYSSHRGSDGLFFHMHSHTNTGRRSHKHRHTHTNTTSTGPGIHLHRYTLTHMCTYRAIHSHT